LQITGSTEAYLCLGSAYRLMAEDDLNRDRDASAHWQAAEQAFAKVIALNPNHTEVYRSLGRLLTTRARAHFLQGESPQQALTAARNALERARELLSQSPYVLMASARAELVHALWSSRQGREDCPAAETGLQYVQAALAVRPDFAEAIALKACLLNLTSSADQPGHLFQSALAANAHLTHEWSPLFQPPVTQVGMAPD
jgi:tetratricopeptide (TPR) repeat protein